MQKTIRALLLLLCLSLLLASCSPRGEQPGTTETDRRLIPEEVTCAYTDTELDALCGRLTELGSRAIFLIERLVLNDAQKTSLKNAFLNSRIFGAEARQITAAELDELLSRADRLISAAEQNEAAGTGEKHSLFSLFKQTYREALLLLGSERAGLFTYDLTLSWLQSEIDTCLSRYEKYGQERHLQDANALKERKRSMIENLGEVGFSNACSILLFAGSALPELFQASVLSDEALVTDAERLLFLQKQAAQMQSNALTATEWNEVLELIKTLEDRTNFIGGSLTVLQAGEIDALMDEAYLRSVSEAIPLLITDYHRLANTLTAEDMQLLREGTAADRAAVICRAIQAHEAEYRTSADKLSSLLAFASEAEQKLIERTGNLSAYEAYHSAVGTADTDALFAAVKTCAESGDAQALSTLTDTCRAYLHGILPYASFVFDFTQEVSAS